MALMFRQIIMVIKSRPKIAAGERYRKAFLLLPVFILLALIFSLQPAVAQSEKTVLDMYVLDGYNSTIKPGVSNIFFVELRNSGTVSLSNIVLSDIAPDNWAVIFDPGKIESLTPGSSRSVQINITPPANSNKGYYNVTVIANSNELRQVATIYTHIESSLSLWLWIGVAIAIVVIVAFLYIFFRLNRQQ